MKPADNGVIINAVVVDTRGLGCPLPVLRAEKRALQLEKGEGFCLLATDPMAEIDILLFCRRNGFLATCTQDNGVFRFEIWRRQAPVSC